MNGQGKFNFDSVMAAKEEEKRRRRGEDQFGSGKK